MKKGIMLSCLVLAILAAVVYFLMAMDVLQAGNLQPDEAPTGIAYVAGACYLVGGLLILVRKRWLWIIGSLINALVLVMFFTAYTSRPDVMLSIAGLGTKIPQVLLEIGLIYLIVSYRQEDK